MIIAITSSGKKLTSQVDVRFGRAKYFILYNTNDLSVNVYENNQNLSALQGAGIQSAQNVVELNAEILITGNCGPKAFEILNLADIKIFITRDCSVQDALDLYLANQLAQLNEANLEGHWI